MLALICLVALTVGADAEVRSIPQAASIRRLDGTIMSCTAQQVLKGHPTRVGKWIIIGPPPGDPFGFGGLINNLRARLGLRTLAYDPNLSAWASQNNSAQCRSGLGHHVNPNCWQNAGWNYADATSAYNGWLASPSHYQAMVANVSTYGIAYGPGPYWTLNLR